MSLAITGLTWGPLGAWVGAGATVLIVIVTTLVALGFFDSIRGPHIRLTFEATEPWVRHGKTEDSGRALWVRIGVENVGSSPARGCLGRMNHVQTEGETRRDIDPLQLRWAGVPLSRAFDPIDLRRDQREYIDVLCLITGARWRLVTWQDPDFDPGFSTYLPLDEQHVVQISIYADNARTVTRSLCAQASTAGDEVRLQLV